MPSPGIPTGPPVYDDPIAGQFPNQNIPINAGSPGQPIFNTTEGINQNSVSLGALSAALAAASMVEERRPGSGGASVLANMDRRIGKLEGTTATLTAKVT